MKNINIIQVVLIGISVIAIVAAVVMFSLFRGGNNGQKAGNVLMWGTIPEDNFNLIIQNLSLYGEEIDNLIYVEKNKNTINEDLLKAIAEGNGPDLVLLNEKQIIQNQKMIQTIPFKSFPLRDYQDLFIEEASLLVSRDGLLGFPFLVDPMIMYYNKDLIANAGFSKPPQTWTEILAITPTLTQKDSSFNISKSAIALGSFDNITNSKNIFWMLVLQAGNPVIKRFIDSQDNLELYTSILNDNLNYNLNPAYAASNFFTQFSNPTKTVYTWNRSLQNSQNMFVSNDLVFYLGMASELPLIKKLNPNLNFDISVVPQSQSSNRKVTYGAMDILVIPRTSKNISGAMSMVGKLTSQSVQKEFAKSMGVASVRRDLLSTTDSSNPYEIIFNKSAIIAQGVLEPDNNKTNVIIKELVETIVSGQYEITDAISRANEKLLILLTNE